MFCTIVGESDSTVRIRLADQWDVDIYKEMILVVDAFPHTDMTLAPQNFAELNPTAQSTQMPSPMNV